MLLIILQEVSYDEMSILSSADLTVEEVAMKSMLIRTRRKVKEASPSPEDSVTIKSIQIDKRITAVVAG